MNNDQKNYFNLLPKECIYLTLDYCELEDIPQMAQLSHTCNYIFHDLIKNPLFIDKIIENLGKIDTFSEKKLEFLMKIKFFIKKRLLERIQDQDLKSLSHLIKNKKNLNINYARLSTFKMKVILYLMNTKILSRSISLEISILNVLDLIPDIHTDSLLKRNKRLIKNPVGNFLKKPTAKKAFSKASTIPASKASINDLLNNDLDHLLNDESEDPTWTATKFSLEEDSNIEQIKNALLKSKISNLESSSKAAYYFTKIMILYFFLMDHSFLFITGFENIYEVLERQNLPLNSSSLDDIILEHLTDNRISENEWVIEFNQFLNNLDQIFNSKIQLSNKK